MTFQSANVTLEIRSRSPKSNQQFPFSKQCIYASLIKIYRLVQKITHINHILVISKYHCDLENKVKVILLLPTMYLYKFGEDPSTSSEDNAPNQYLDISSEAVTLK